MTTYANRLAALYASGKLNATQIGAAVTRGWITQEEADQIIGQA